MSMYKSCKRYHRLILLPYISRRVAISAIPVAVTHEAMPCIMYASLWLKEIVFKNQRKKAGLEMIFLLIYLFTLSFRMEN